ncbi:hypothetical protein PCANC_25047 [Puccinia coronata f. sp. avenae]|uniref:RING-type domain-containing protein n=1 Tax=Puccinia coronata f. sp. avenae TaxID=200324 RepID=A0A2N5U1J9_9BASI|nr:hypothetical protein PCANC_25047 [Puccinia coronata f. sp. avenae]
MLLWWMFFLLVGCKCHHEFQVGPAESSVGGMAVPDELAHSGHQYCDDSSNPQTTPHELSTIVDHKRREIIDHEEPPKNMQESPAQLPATSDIQSNVDPESRCPICQEFYCDTQGMKVITAWECEHHIHSDCWDTWKKPEDSPRARPHCPFCRKTSRRTPEDEEKRLRVEAHRQRMDAEAAARWPEIEARWREENRRHAL